MLLPIAYFNLYLIRFLSGDSIKKTARMKLAGKILAINFKELSKPLILIFYKQRVEVVSQCSISVDCTVKTALITLMSLKKTTTFNINQ